MLDNVLYARAYTSTTGACRSCMDRIVYRCVSFVSSECCSRRRTPDGAAGLRSGKVSRRRRRVQTVGEQHGNSVCLVVRPETSASRRSDTFLIRSSTPSWLCSESTSLAVESWPRGSRSWPRCFPGCRRSLKV